jgi:hypothetical protein
MEYWIDLAVGWLEQGVPLDEEIVEALSREYPKFFPSSGAGTAPSC